MKNIYNFLFLILSGICFSSCSGYLDKLPLDGPSSESFVTNEQELKVAVTGCYNELWFQPSDGQPFTSMFEYISDIGWDRNGSGYQSLGRGVIDLNNSVYSTWWKEMYKGIARCNSVLEKAPAIKDKIPPATYNDYIGQVRFLRAYFYSFLNELYNGVPLITKSLSLEESQTPRSTKGQIKDFLYAELDLAATELPSTTSEKGRVTKGTALALKSRIALYNQDWSVAANAAKAVIDMNVYQLHSNFGELFMYKGSSSKEAMLTVEWMQGYKTNNSAFNFYSRMAGGYTNKIPVQSLVDSYECIDGKSIDKSSLYNPLKPYENRDPRLGFTVVLPQTAFMGYLFETNKDSLLTWNYNVTPAVRVGNVEATHAYATFSGYCWRKYTDPIDMPNKGGSTLPYILFRYAEVLLNYAEAKIEANQIDQSVYDAINLVRQRPSVNMPAITSGKTQIELRSVIHKERKYEFAGEGLRFFDIRRWKTMEKVMPGNLYGRIPKGNLSNPPVIDENGDPDYSNVANKSQMRVIEVRSFDKTKDYVWPIPQIELLTNKELVQNQGY